MMYDVNVGTDHIGMIAMGEPPGQLAPNTVRIFRRNLAGDKRLPEVVGNHIIRAAHPAGFGDVLLFGKGKFSIGGSAVTGKGSNPSAAIGFLGILYIIDHITDSRAECPAPAGMQRHNTGGCHGVAPFIFLPAQRFIEIISGVSIIKTVDSQ